MTLPPYPVGAGRLVQLAGLVFHRASARRQHRWPANLVDGSQSLSRWRTNHLSWIARRRPDVRAELESSWVPVGIMGRKCTTWTTELFFFYKMNSLCLDFGLVLLCFLYFIFNWWNLVGWHGKHLLDNQHRIHGRQTEHTGFFDPWCR